jgi:hypothetical protein
MTLLMERKIDDLLQFQLPFGLEWVSI